MRRYWKLFLIITVVTALAYLAWQIYADYQLSAYPQQIIDTIPMPPGVRLIKQRDGSNKECRSAGIVRYYATDLPWEQVIAFYRSYVETSPWKPRIEDEAYFWDHSPENQRLNLNFRWIKTTDNDITDIERQALSSGETVYLVQVGYTQDVRASNTYCKPED